VISEVVNGHRKQARPKDLTLSIYMSKSSIDNCPACGPQEFAPAGDGQTFCTSCGKAKWKAQEDVDAGLAGPNASKLSQALMLAAMGRTPDTRSLTDDELIQLSLVLASMGEQCRFTPSEAQRCMLALKKRGKHSAHGSRGGCATAVIALMAALAALCA
jgi:hypothetical protein